MNICKFCRTPISLNEDIYTGAIWVKCENNKCQQYGAVSTYIYKEEYKRKAANDLIIK